MGNAYLALYNASLFIAWAVVLFLTWRTVLLEHGGTADVWKAVEVPLKVAQTAALLEILHSALRLVRSPVGITAMQVASRIWCLWGIVNLAPQATTTRGIELAHVGDVHIALNLISLLTAWGLSEVIRYGFFALKEVGVELYPMTWLRYSGFIVLYPIGVASELTMAYLALPTLQKQQPWSVALPNWFNFGFSYHWACIAIMLSYLPGLPQLYLYLLSNRRKNLGPKKVKAA